MRGFSLLELSIVLVIIGLLTSGVLVGRDLIKQSEIRSTITQIDSYRLAINGFKLKYNNLPGDIKEPLATQVGLAPRGAYRGEGDGNGIIEGNLMNTAFGSDGPSAGYCDEGPMVWVDLTRSAMIKGSFTNYTAPDCLTVSSGEGYLPKTNLDNGSYIFVWSGGPRRSPTSGFNDGKNYFTLAKYAAYGSFFMGSPGLTTAQAYAIDSKVDDGKPTTGKALALTLQPSPFWSNGIFEDPVTNMPSTTTASPPTSVKCAHNGGVASATYNYNLVSANENTVCTMTLEW